MSFIPEKEWLKTKEKAEEGTNEVYKLREEIRFLKKEVEELKERIQNLEDKQ